MTPKPRKGPGRIRKAVHEDLSPPRARTLLEGVLATFPAAKPDELRAWQGRVRERAEAEPLLFAAVVCGVHFRVSHPDPVMVLKRLRAWLTSPPRHMPEDLAELLLEAWTADISRAVRARPWTRGPGATPVELTGRPPDARGAWAAALVVEQDLTLSRIELAEARQFALELLGVFLGRPIGDPQHYGMRKRCGTEAITVLSRAVAEQYESWLTLEGTRRREPPPERDDQEAYGSWRARYRDLHHLLAVSGCEDMARTTLDRLPNELWSLLEVGLAGDAETDTHP